MKIQEVLRVLTPVPGKDGTDDHEGYSGRTECTHLFLHSVKDYLGSAARVLARLVRWWTQTLAQGWELAV